MGPTSSSNYTLLDTLWGRQIGRSSRQPLSQKVITLDALSTNRYKEERFDLSEPRRSGDPEEVQQLKAAKAMKEVVKRSTWASDRDPSGITHLSTYGFKSHGAVLVNLASPVYHAFEQCIFLFENEIPIAELAPCCFLHSLCLTPYGLHALSESEPITSHWNHLGEPLPLTRAKPGLWTNQDRLGILVSDRFLCRILRTTDTTYALITDLASFDERYALLFSGSFCTNVTAATAHDGLLYIATKEQFTPESPIQLFTLDLAYGESALPIPIKAPGRPETEPIIDMVVFREKLILWQLGALGPRLLELDLFTGIYRNLGHNSSSPIHSIAINENFLVVTCTEEDKEALHLYDMDRGEQVYSYRNEEEGPVDLNFKASQLTIHYLVSDTVIARDFLCLQS